MKIGEDTTSHAPWDNGQPNALVHDGVRPGGAVLAANLKAGTIYIFERAKSQRRSRERQRIPAIRYVGMNGHKYMFEKVGIHDAQKPDACNEGKIFLSKGALEYLASEMRTRSAC
jgi:hypothetical protein